MLYVHIKYLSFIDDQNLLNTSQLTYLLKALVFLLYIKLQLLINYD